MRSKEDWEALAREVMLARYAAWVVSGEFRRGKQSEATTAASEAATPGILTMDLSPPPPPTVGDVGGGESAGPAPPPLTISERDTVQVTYEVYGHAEGRWAARGDRPLHAAEGLKLELNPASAPRGLAAGAHTCLTCTCQTKIVNIIQ